jgi:hypothetical protein
MRGANDAASAQAMQRLEETSHSTVKFLLLPASEVVNFLNIELH